MTPEEQIDLKFSFLELDGDERLCELMLYISDKCSDDPSFGATKLNKILYFADFLSYVKYGEPITGVEYMRLERGPAPRYLIPLRKKMMEDSDIIVKKTKFHQYEQHRTIALREANIEIFKSRDIALVDEIIHAFWGITAEEVSQFSHGIEWRIAKSGENIPYQAAYLSEKRITQDDIERAKELIIEHGYS